MATQRYLLFDSGCSLCTALARSVERESAGFLTARSLRDPEVQEMLGRVRPGWRWEPMLMEVQGEHVRVSSGVRMRFRLLIGLGPARAWRIANIVRKAPIRNSEASNAFGEERRRLLARGFALLGTLVAWPILELFSSDSSARAANVDGDTAKTNRGAKENSGPQDWRAALDIERSEELSGSRLTEAVRRFQAAIDTKELAGVFDAQGLKLSDATYKAVRHQLRGANSFLAVGAQWDKADGSTYVAAHYALPQSIANFRHGTYLYKVDGQTLRLLALSVNGQLVRLSSDVTAQSHCGGCVDFVSGPWEYSSDTCTAYNWSCLYPCCATCVIAGQMAWLCVLILCVPCLALCCTAWQHGCAQCADPPAA